MAYNPNSTTSHLPVTALLPTATRVTIGSFICFTEGFGASVLFMLPRNQWAAIGGLCLSVAFLLFAERFRRSSALAADISDLMLYDVVAWTCAVICYQAGVQQEFTWYLSYSLSFLKLLRLYMWQGSVTYEQGWGILGPMSYLHAKQSGSGVENRKPAMYRALLLAVCGAVGGAIAIKYASDPLRLAVAWLLPLTFELIFGPRQLASLAQFVPAFLAGNQREAAQLAEIAELKKALAAAKQSQAMPPDPNLAALIACYNGTTPKRRKHLLFYATNVAELFPEGEPDTDT